MSFPHSPACSPPSTSAAAGELQAHRHTRVLGASKVVAPTDGESSVFRAGDTDGASGRLLLRCHVYLPGPSLPAHGFAGLPLPPASSASCLLVEVAVDGVLMAAVWLCRQHPALLSSCPQLLPSLAGPPGRLPSQLDPSSFPPPVIFRTVVPLPLVASDPEINAECSPPPPCCTVP